MEREASSMLSMAAQMCMIAALLGLVVFTIIYGQDVKSFAFMKISDVNTEVSTGMLAELRDCTTEMSVASAYNIINASDKSIGNAVCYLDHDSKLDAEGYTRELKIARESNGQKKFCLRYQLSGRCKMVVSYDFGTSSYNIELRPLSYNG